MVRVGFIGLGSQGAPMARRIVEDGYPLTVWGRRPETVAPFADTAATVVSTPAEVGAASDLVGLCVVTDADVEEVLLRPGGVLAGMAPGGVIAVHSTIHPATCHRLAEKAAGHGVTLIDAPVSGGAPSAAAGRLLVMAGGDEVALTRCRPVFETFGDPVLHLGALGSGQVAKALNNLVFTAQIAVGLTTFGFADGLGVDRAALARVLANGSGGSRAAAILARSGFDTSGIAQHAPVLRKDIDIALDLAKAGGVTDQPLLFELADTALRLLGHHR
ncbi:NAD(P)-dependent oxidoreductase [Parafrankia sp. FMc6]|uniref:NAD(P)-dependent oxidoreductase n=1 Tax=Parafrankia soli TaxID=2599596 RepID=UPI0034D6D103